jgi:hypothetical protein
VKTHVHAQFLQNYARACAVDMQHAAAAACPMRHYTATCARVLCVEVSLLGKSCSFGTPACKAGTAGELPLLGICAALQEEMERLLLAVRDVAMGKGPAAVAAAAAASAAADEEVGQVQALLASLGSAATHSSGAAASAGSRRQGTAGSNATGSSQSAAAAAGQLMLSERQANHSRQEFAKVGGTN